MRVLGYLCKIVTNLSPISSAVLGLAAVAGVLGQAEYDYTDDFSCPDELEGFYPHLYR